MMLLATVASTMLTTAGLAISYSPDLPTGAITILLAAGLYIGTIACRSLLPGFKRQPRAGR
jgi:ABC-type Mn2+/Zn2+ transport system permease subunit